MKKLLLTVAFTISFLFLATTDSVAQYQRIKFKRGASSATLSGKISFNDGIAGPAYEKFIVSATKGQTINVTVSSKNGDVVIIPNEKRSYTFKADRTGDIEITIFNGGDEKTIFKLTVSIR